MNGNQNRKTRKPPGWNSLMLRHFITESGENTIGWFIKFPDDIKPKGVEKLLKKIMIPTNPDKAGVGFCKKL